jgi:hypothetical protein
MSFLKRRIRKLKSLYTFQKRHFNFTSHVLLNYNYIIIIITDIIVGLVHSKIQFRVQFNWNIKYLKNDKELKKTKIKVKLHTFM